VEQYERAAQLNPETIQLQRCGMMSIMLLKTSVWLSCGELAIESMDGCFAIMNRLDDIMRYVGRDGMRYRSSERIILCCWSCIHWGLCMWRRCCFIVLRRVGFAMLGRSSIIVLWVSEPVLRAQVLDQALVHL
jgi:hypothetical protein